MFFSCVSFQAASSAVIDVSGDDSNTNGYAYANIIYQGIPFKRVFNTSSSGFGWCGVCIVALKDIGSPKPFLEDLVIAKTGRFIEPERSPADELPPELPFQNDKYVDNGSGSYYTSKMTRTDWFPSKNRVGIVSSDTDYATESNRAAIHVMNFVVAGEHTPEIGVDPVNSAPSPTISFIERINTPRTSQGDQVTYEFTAQEDPDTKYVEFETRIRGSGSEWNKAEYILSFESIARLTANGDEIQVRATAYSLDYRAGGETRINIILPTVTKDSEESDGGSEAPPIEITVPNIKRLELVNRIDDNENWNKWKSPNAEFRWAKLSTTNGGSIVQVNGSTDLHLEGYKVIIKKTNGDILREEITKDSFYTYTFDKNKKDTNGSPVRELIIKVQAITTTGYVSEFSRIKVENPAPSAPANVTSLAGFTSILFTYDLPSDTDFVGIDFYILEGESGDVYADGAVTRVSGNTFNPDGLKLGTTYQVGAVSVDQFGTGGQINQFGIITSNIDSSVLGDITTPLTLDENGGRIITNNSGYYGIMGVTDLPDVEGDVIFAAHDAILEETIFYVDVDGQMRLNFINALAAIAVGSAVFGGAGCQIENNNGDPRMYIGSGTPDTGITYENQELAIGLDVAAAGIDAYSNVGYIYYNIPAPLIDEYKTSSTNLTASPSGGVVLFQTGAAGFFEYSANIINSSFEKMNMDNEVRLKIVLQASLGNGADECDLFIGFRTGIGSTRDGFIGARIKAKSGTNSEYDLYAVKGYDTSDGDVGPSSESIGDEVRAGEYYVYEIIYTPTVGVSVEATALSGTNPIQSASASIDSTGISELSSVLDIYAFRGNRYSPSFPTFRSGDFKITGRGD